MKIKRAIILGAGYGKRLRPITLKIPKPLIKINGVTLLENSIKLLSSLGVKHIIVNAHHLHKQITKFVKRKKFSSKVDVVVERKKILNTGGGILNASKKFKKQPFFVLNPDTLWDLKKYKKEFRKLEKFYFKNKKPTMLLVSKKKSFDQSLKGDFNLNFKNEILREKSNKFIFTGAQIINRSVFKKRKIKSFSMNKVWDNLIKEKNLFGVVSHKKFFHINNYKIYKKLNKKVIG